MNILGPFIRNVIFSSFFDIHENEFRSILRAKNKHLITYRGFKGQRLKINHLLYLHFLELRKVCSDRIFWSEPNTVFLHIVSAETILFWHWPYVLWPLLTVHKCAETIQGRKLFKGGNYMRKYGISICTRYTKGLVISVRGP